MKRRALRWLLAAAAVVLLLLILLIVDLHFAVTGITARILNVIVGTAETFPGAR